jgi:hypothetical protein
MVTRASGLGMRAGRLSRPRRGVGVLAMSDERLNTMRGDESVCEIPPSASVLRLLVPGMAVVVIFDRRCVADDVTVMR